MGPSQIGIITPYEGQRAHVVTTMTRRWVGGWVCCLVSWLLGGLVGGMFVGLVRLIAWLLGMLGSARQRRCLPCPALLLCH